MFHLRGDFFRLDGPRVQRLVIGHHLSRGDGTRGCSKSRVRSFFGAAARATKIELS